MIVNKLIKECNQLVLELENISQNDNSNLPKSHLEILTRELLIVEKSLADSRKLPHIPNWGRSIIDVWPLNDPLAERLISFEQELKKIR